MTMLDYATDIRRAIRERNEARDRLLASQFFLVSLGNGAGSIGERLKCVGKPELGWSGCGGYHRYLTVRCVERPFDGIEEGLYGYWAALKDLGVVETFDLGQQAKWAEITRALGTLPNLGAGHPQTVRLLDIADGDVDVGAVAVGVLEPITRAQAAERVRRINLRGVPFSLPGLAERSR